MKFRNNPSDKKNQQAEQNQSAQTELAEKEPVQKETNKGKRSFGMWMALSLCFLVLIGAISLYLQSPKSSKSNIEMRSMTLTDAGFDTPVTFQAECSEEDFNKYLAIVKNIFQQSNAMFDAYNEYDQVNSLLTINEQAADHPVEITDEFADLMKISRSVAEISDKFDITEGKLLHLWHDAREADVPYLPDDAQIQLAMQHTGLDGVTVENNTISFSDDSIALDLGAIAKGYTAQLCADALKETGLTNGFINAGGNVVLIGNKLDGSDWRVGIQKPDSQDSLVIVTLDHPEALVTSGDYQRYMEVDGKRYGHIIDPDTGYPPQNVRSVTVINEDSALADGMSTALFCLSVDEGLQLCRQQSLEAIWITDRTTKTDAKPLYSTEQFDIYTTPGIASSVTLAKGEMPATAEE